mgnify:CR=1 FL=1
MEMNANSFMNDVDYLHLTNLDLDHRKKNKPFEKITLRDFDYCITDAVKASYVFFIDFRQKRNWIRKLIKNGKTAKRIKLLKPQNIEIHK